ncbi:MAG: TerB family tellurite resistance protein [Deltaproteobacteria bacterium]|nr:TerB family tellurite resistance protein [Deltaproteobacteria bacterium]
MNDELSPSPARPSDEALLALLTFVAGSDGSIHDREVDFLAKLFPTRPRATLEAEAARFRQASDFALLAIADQFHSDDQRWLGLRFADRMAWRDGTLDDAERKLLGEVAVAMGLPNHAVERVVQEMRPDRKERLSPERMVKVVRELRWDSVQLASGDLVSPDLAALVPPGSQVVVRVGIDRVEVLALCTDGLLARFQDGAAFVAWDDLVSYGREGAIGTGVRLTTEDGREYVLVDHRLTGLCRLLDRLLDDRERKQGAPIVSRLRGEG